MFYLFKAVHVDHWKFGPWERRGRGSIAIRTIRTTRTNPIDPTDPIGPTDPDPDRLAGRAADTLGPVEQCCHVGCIFRARLL